MKEQEFKQATKDAIKRYPRKIKSMKSFWPLWDLPGFRAVDGIDFSEVMAQELFEQAKQESMK
jgi:hypothetical protein